MVPPTANSAAAPAAAKAYSSEEVQQILQAALSYQSDRPFSRNQLEEMAAELNISPETLAKAEAAWQAAAAERQGAKQRRTAYRQQLGSYLAVNTGLILINLATCGTISWAVYPLLGWGLGLCLGPNKMVCGRQRRSSAV